MIQPWIRLTRTSTANTKLFCFPHSGAGAQAYFPFAIVKSQFLDVYALELPGRGRRFSECLNASLPAIVCEAVDGLQQIIENENVIFLGHSLGGLLAFEAIRELRRRVGAMPKHLFISGVRAPQLPQRRKKISDLPQDDFVGYLKKFEGTAQEILENPEMLKLIAPILRNDLKVYESYQYIAEDPLKCPITAFCGAKDPFVSPESVRQWTEQTSSGFRRYVIEGGHFFLFDHVEEITTTINQILKEPS